MPPPGFPEWVFPGAVVRRGDEAAIYAIGNLELNTSEADQCVVFLQRILARDGELFLDAGQVSETTSMDDLIQTWQHTGDYLYPSSMRNLATITGHHPIGTTLELTNASGGTGVYLVVGHADGNSQIARRIDPVLPGLSPTDPVYTVTSDANGLHITLNGGQNDLHIGGTPLEDQNVFSGTTVFRGNVIFENNVFYSTPAVVVEGAGGAIGPSNIRVGDEWQLSVPNEGIWRVEAIDLQLNAQGEETITLRGQDQAVMRVPSSWLVSHALGPLVDGKVVEVPAVVRRTSFERLLLEDDDDG